MGGEEKRREGERMGGEVERRGGQQERGGRGCEEKWRGRQRLMTSLSCTFSSTGLLSLAPSPSLSLAPLIQSL